MGQRSVFLLDRQGSCQFWDGVWNSEHNYSSLFLNFFFIDYVVSAFIKNKNSVNYFFVKKNDDLLQHFIKNNYTYDENFSICNNIFQKKRIHSKFFYLFGTTWVFKYQTWYVICSSVYHPIKQAAITTENNEQIFEFFELKKSTFEKF